MESISKKTNLLNPALRNTPQRSLILEIIETGAGHLDADEIYRRAKERHPRISLSTVYRTLQALKRLGMIEELHFDDSHHHYQLKSMAEHHHIVCLGCGRVIEFQYPVAQYVKRNVPEARDFEILDTDLHVTGLCRECRRVKEN